LKLGIEVYK